MGMRAFEAEILREAKVFLHNSKLRQMDIQEWSSAPIPPHEGEDVVHLPEKGVYIAVLHGISKIPPLQHPPKERLASR